MTLGQYIKKLRDDKQISSEDLCNSTGIDSKILYDLENDATMDRDYNTIYALTKYFKINPSSFAKIDALNVDLEKAGPAVFSILRNANYPNSFDKSRERTILFFLGKKTVLALLSQLLNIKFISKLQNLLRSIP